VCFAQNKQNLYSLNRMTLYKFSCAAMGLQVYVFVCVWVCVGGWADKHTKTFLYMFSCAHVFVYIMEKFFIEFAQK